MAKIDTVQQYQQWYKPVKTCSHDKVTSSDSRLLQQLTERQKKYIQSYAKITKAMYTAEVNWKQK